LNAENQATLIVRQLGRVAYEPVWNQMQAFTNTRAPDSPDELWLVEHDPVFTQGQAGKPEHVLELGTDIPLVQSDRGGQVTYHGPGQLVLYPLLDIRRLGIGVRELVTRIEQSVIAILNGYGIESEARSDAPGVYVAGQKIASLGLRVRHGRSFHGVAINFDMDLSPFQRINPCGYPGLEMTSLAMCLEGHSVPSFESFRSKCAIILARAFGYEARAFLELSEPFRD